MAFVLRHSSRSIEGVYLKSPEIENVSTGIVTLHKTVLSIVPAHILIPMVWGSERKWKGIMK